MKRILEYLPIITVCLIYFGYNNLYGYYREFGIEIHNYVNSTEIIMSFLPTIVVLGAMFYSVTIQNIIHSRNDSARLDSEVAVGIDDGNSDQPTGRAGKMRRWALNLFKSLIFWYFLLSLIIACFKILLLKFYEDYELQDFDLFASIFSAVLIYFIIYQNRSSEWIKQNTLLLLAITIYICGNTLSTYRKNDAKKIKGGYGIANLSLKRYGQEIKTGKFLLYVGQTQTHLFLYNKRDSSVTIFKQSELDSLNIKL